MRFPHDSCAGYQRQLSVPLVNRVPVETVLLLAKDKWRGEGEGMIEPSLVKRKSWWDMQRVGVTEEDANDGVSWRWSVVVTPKLSREEEKEEFDQ